MSNNVLDIIKWGVWGATWMKTLSECESILCDLHQLATHFTKWFYSKWEIQILVAKAECYPYTFANFIVLSKKQLAWRSNCSWDGFFDLPLMSSTLLPIEVLMHALTKWRTCGTSSWKWSKPWWFRQTCHVHHHLSHVLVHKF